MQHFTQLGINLDELQAVRRPLLKVCTDWTEQRHHLAGGLGAALMRALTERGWIERRSGRRDFRVHRPEQIQTWLMGG